VVGGGWWVVVVDSISASTPSRNVTEVELPPHTLTLAHCRKPTTVVVDTTCDERANVC
jgi:hypothetical protein